MQATLLTTLEELASNLPNANNFDGTCYHQMFTYKSRKFEIKFYIVSESYDGKKFWLYNPNNLTPVFENGSYMVQAV